MASPPATAMIVDIHPQANGEQATAAAAATGASTAPVTPNSRKSAGGGVLPTTAPAAQADEPTTTMSDKVISSAANLAQLLPTGSVLAYQALAPSFTRHGKCYSSNQWLTAALVVVIAALSFFFSFTDSVVGRDGKLYYGVATPRGLNVFNFSGEEEDRIWALGELKKLRLRPLDFVHAFFTVVVFLTVAFSDVGLQKCFFPGASASSVELLTNLPLGMALLSSFVFMIFPTKRRGIGYNDATPHKKIT